MSAAQLPRCSFVTAVMDRCSLPAAGWRDWFTAELRARGFGLEGDGTLLSPDQALIGFAQLLEADVVLARWGREPWFAGSGACPWLGRVAGYLCWTLIEESVRADFVSALARRARGPSYKLAAADGRAVVALLPHSLDSLLQRRGFDDGDCFLDREPQYLQATAAAINAVLRQAGLPFQVGVLDTHHNPFWIDEPAAARQLARLQARLWTYDSQVLCEQDFWREQVP